MMICVFCVMLYGEVASHSRSCLVALHLRVFRQIPLELSEETVGRVVRRDASGLQDIEPPAGAVVRQQLADAAAQLWIGVVVHALQRPHHVPLPRARRAILVLRQVPGCLGIQIKTPNDGEI